MFDYNEINHIARYSVLMRSSERGKLVIWQDLPYWLLVDDNCVKLLSLVEGRKFTEIIEALKADMKETVDEE